MPVPGAILPDNGSEASAELILRCRFMLPDKSEHACRITALGPEGAVLLTQDYLPPRTPVVLYIDELGRIEAEAGGFAGQGFALSFRLKGPPRERFIARLRWVREKESGQIPSERRHARVVPRQKQAQITLADGRGHPCQVLDISLSGAAIMADVKPGLGVLLLLGKTRSRVVRHFAGGFAVEFVRHLEKGALDKPLA